MKLEWDEEKNQKNIKKHKVGFKDNYTKEDFKNGVWIDGSDNFTTDEKILMAIKAYVEAGKIIDKEKLRKEVDLILK
ncbi:MAG: hypothetical protein Q4F88_06740 [Eubacteriales bacterium]|nr:hypothetical protein [Eubacteriales bacterium]